MKRDRPRAAPRNVCRHYPHAAKRQSWLHDRSGKAGAVAPKAVTPVEQSARNTARRKRDHNDQYAAIDDEIESRGIAGKELGELAQRLDHKRSHERPQDGPDTADDRSEQRLDRYPGPICNARVDEQIILRIE